MEPDNNSFVVPVKKSDTAFNTAPGFIFPPERALN